MNTKFLYTIIVAFILLLPVCYISAQVTIGSSLPPRAGALLDLKEFEGEIGGVTANAGLGLPRVALVDNLSLLPTITAGEAAQAGVAEMYTGLMVYNVGDENVVSEVTQLCKGLHVWDGTKWTPIKPYPTHDFGQNVIRCAEGPSYTIDCNSIQVFGVYNKNVALDNSHYIELTTSVRTIS